jgi:hypothetical protein
MPPKQASPWMMLCGVSIVFNSLGDVLGLMSFKHSSENGQVFVGFQSTEAFGGLSAEPMITISAKSWQGGRPESSAFSSSPWFASAGIILGGSNPARGAVAVSNPCQLGVTAS